MAKAEMESMANALNLQNLHPFGVLIPLLLLCLFLYKWLRNPSGTKLPPSPWGVPVMGNIFQVGASPHRGLHALSQRHGDIMLLHFGSNPVLVISSSKLASQVLLRTHDLAFASRRISGVFYRLLYEGKDMVSAPFGELWRHVRSVSVLKLLSNSMVRSYREVREEEVAAMVAKIEGLVGTEIDLSNMCMELTNDIVCRGTLGRKYDQKSEFKRLLDEIIELLGGFFVSDFVPWLGWIDKLTGLDQRVETVRREMDEFVESVVQQHEERAKNPDPISHGAMDFVDVLVGVQKEESAAFHLERVSIKAIIQDIFVGGTDTTSSGLVWAMVELLKNPKSMKALQAEVRRFIRPDKRSISEEDIPQMKYLKAVIKETMRLHPPLPLLIPHISTQVVELNGYTIPAGTQLIVNAWAIHRDPSSWASPGEFLPERFLDSSVDLLGQDFDLIPFGSGRRSCPGMGFALCSIELALVSLVGLFDWGLPGGAEPQSLDMEEKKGITVHKKNPIIVVPSLPIP